LGAKTTVAGETAARGGYRPPLLLRRSVFLAVNNLHHDLDDLRMPRIVVETYDVEYPSRMFRWVEAVTRTISSKYRPGV
jgi:hypothetical protein